MGIGKLLGNIFKNQIQDVLFKDEHLKQSLKEGDIILDEMKKNVLDLMVRGNEVPHYAMRYINLNNLSNNEKLYLRVKIEESINNNICPVIRAIEASDFNSKHPLWERYLMLKSNTDSKKKKAQDNRLKGEKKALQEIFSKYGKENYERAKLGEIFEDMDEYLLLIAKGKPAKKESNLVKGKSSEIWYYEKYKTRLNTESYKFSVRLVEGKIKGWKNL